MSLPDENGKPVPLDIMVIFDTMCMSVKPEGQKASTATELPVRRLVTANVDYTGSYLDAKKTAHCRRVLVVSELFNIAINNFGAKESVCCV